MNLTGMCDLRIFGHIDLLSGEWTVIDRNGKSFIVTRIDFVVYPRPKLPSGYEIDFTSANSRNIKANGDPGAINHRMYIGLTSTISPLHIPAEVVDAAEKAYRELATKGLPS